MRHYYHLEDKKLLHIEDRHFTDDSSAIVGFNLTLMKHQFLRDAVNEQLTYIGPIPSVYKDRILHELD